MSESPSHFVAVCPNCLVSLRIHADYSGRHVRCKHCNHKFQALAPDFPSPTPSSDEYTTGPHAPLGPPSERLEVACPHCASELSVRKAYAGQFVRCKKCGEKFLVPNIVEAQPATAAASQPAAALDDLFDQLYRDHDETSETDQPGEEPGVVPAREPDPQLLDRLAAAEAARAEALARVEQLEADRTRLEAQDQTFRRDLDELRGELERVRAERDAYREQAEHRDQALAGSEARIQGLTEQLRRHDEERLALAADRDRLEAERDAAAEEAARLRDQFAGREHELLQRVQHLEGEAEELRRRLEELDRLRAEEARHSGALQRAWETREAELRAEFQAALDAERTGSAEQLAGAEARCQETAALAERLKAEILTLAQSRSGTDADLEAARLEIQDLRSKLAETETSKQSMSSLLEGMGIRLH